MHCETGGMPEEEGSVMSKINIFDILEKEPGLMDDASQYEVRTNTNRVLAKVSAAVDKDKGTAKKPVRRRFMFVLAAALISTAALICTMAAVAQNGNGTDSSSSGGQFTKQDVLAKMDAEKQEDAERALKESLNEREEQLFFEKRGYSISDYMDQFKEGKISGQDFDKTVYYEYNACFAQAKNEKYSEILNKIVDAGFGDEALRQDAQKNVTLAVSESAADNAEDRTWFFNKTKALCDAYNSQELVLTENERYFLTDYINDLYFTVNQYARMHPGVDDERITEAYDLIEKTIVPKYGYKELVFGAADVAGNR